MKSGIYSIKNTITGKQYIGSSKNLDARQKTHFYQLQNNKHINMYLQRSYNKYECSAFVFIVLEYCEEYNLLEREKFYIEQYDKKDLYNMGSVGGGDNTSQHPLNAEIRQKISAAQTGKSGFPKYGAENGNWRGGKSKCIVCSCELGRSNKSKRCKRHIDRSGENNSFYNKHHSEITKAILSEKRTGSTNLSCAKQINIDGKVYASATQASETLNIPIATISYRAHSKHFKTYYYI